MRRGTMRTKMPWIDREMCDVSEVGKACKAASHCPHDAFQVLKSDNGSGSAYKIAIDFDKCRFCGECSHACDRGIVKMV
jgi:dissimilatory sulfite reductase (desulfoviridin) alpha/beta subunit